MTLMKRRDVLSGVASGAIATTLTSAMTAPTATATANGNTNEDTAAEPDIEWRMATSWPPAIDTLYSTAEEIADRVSAMTQGRFKIQVSAAGELVPGLQVLDAVQEGTAQCGHSAAYYYIGKSKALAFSTAMPFGLTARQQNAWFYQGGGIDAMNQVYKTFNTIAFPAGNTGVQMGGWFKREVNTLADLQGLKMRTAGLGGEVFSRMGVNVQALPAGEILLALELGTIDAAEWVGPYDDEKLGLQETAPYYYYPSWWEPGASLDLMINIDAWNELPERYQRVLVEAAAAASTTCMAKYDARNPLALARLVKGGTGLRRFSDEILQAAKQESEALLEEFASSDAVFREVYTPWKAFRAEVQQWHGLSELGLVSFAAQS
ncbi:MAG: TRAP transporter substrate-binding protein [Leptolyngbyaceae bacterium]|nr:TRAP transporter substrate-binding protein [Leptolyngbyaceae bacterium]